MDFLDISVAGWQLTYTLIALIIPVLLALWVIRLFVNSGKKTVRSIRK